MCLELPFVCETEHLVIHTGRIADAQDIDAPVDEFFRDPVYCHIALCTDQHLALPHQCLIDGFDQCRRLSCSRRTVDDRHILRPQNPVDRPLLRRVQPRQANRSKGEFLCLLP